VQEKQRRSRLEPYGELIDELRRRGLTYRYISEILTGKCRFHVSKVQSTISSEFERDGKGMLPGELQLKPGSPLQLSPKPSLWFHP